MDTVSFPIIPSDGDARRPAAAGGLPAATADHAPRTGDLEQLLDRFLQVLMAQSGAFAGAVRVLDDDGQSLRLVAQRGLPTTVAEREARVRRDCGVCGRAAGAGAGGAEVLAWDDELHHCGLGDSRTFFGVTCRRVLAIALPYGGEVLGLYNLFFDHERGLPPEAEPLFRLIGQLLGLSLHQAQRERERLRLTVLRERQEMVNEVHDAIAQTLAYVRMRLPLLSDAMLAHDDQRSQQVFGDVRKAVGEIHVNLREVMTYFRTRMDPLGLLHALHTAAASFRERTGIALEVHNRAGDLALTEEQEVQVFYIVQEALANIAKHSMARHATVSIEREPQPLPLGSLCIRVEDDGLGMASPSVSTIVTTASEARVSNHLGLEIMHSRARRLGASLHLGSRTDGGTQVRLHLPLERERP